MPREYTKKIRKKDAAGCADIAGFLSKRPKIECKDHSDVEETAQSTSVELVQPEGSGTEHAATEKDTLSAGSGEAFLSMKDVTETAIKQDKSEEVAGNELAELQTTYQQAVQAAETVIQQCETLKEEREKLLAKQRDLQEMRETVKEDTTQVLPKTRYSVSLYSCATGIKWDYDCKPDEIKGYVCTSKDVRPFSLDSRQHSKFFITNYLWDLVEAASEVK